jgi:excinuclease ABC subunit C
MEKKMYEYSKKKNFEKAAQLRDRINDLKYLGERIDFSPDDTEESYKERRKRILKEEFNELKSELGLKELNRIECYDISNIQGKQAYGSMVVAVDGKIRRDQYRIFKIDDIEGSDDPGMLKRVLERRFDKKNKAKYPNDPDIVLIDGGKSQLSGLIPLIGKDIPKTVHLLGISKGKHLKRKGSRQVDEFWLVINESGKIKRVEITNNSILIDLRDEAHRFAILHHRKARIRSSKTSELDSIPGIGIKRRRALLKHFKGIKTLKGASEEEINKVINNKKISKNIYEYFHRR